MQKAGSIIINNWKLELWAMFLIIVLLFPFYYYLVYVSISLNKLGRVFALRNVLEVVVFFKKINNSKNNTTVFLDNYSCFKVQIKQW